MFYLNKIIISIIIGLTQGLSEFFPISSTGHMIVLTHWLDVAGKDTKILEIFVQLGSTLSVSLFFCKKIIKLLRLKIKKENNKTKKYIFLFLFYQQFFWDCFFIIKLSHYLLL